jgi:hypothetical protein
MENAPTFTLSALFFILIFAQFANRDYNGALYTFFYATLLLLATSITTRLYGPQTAWSLFIGIIVLIVLYLLARNGVFSSLKRIDTSQYACGNECDGPPPTDCCPRCNECPCSGNC